MARIVVVGAGVAGLAAAVRLATRGHEVVVLDPAGTPGGPMAAISTPYGRFAATANRLILPAPLRDLFARTGTSLADELTLSPVEPLAAIQLPGLPGLLELPGAGVGASVRQVGEQAGSHLGGRWRAALQQGGQRWATMRDTPDPQDPPNPDPPTVAALAQACALAAGAGGQVPADARMMAYLAATFGAWQVAGGVPALAVALAGRAAQRGAQILLDTRPTAVVVQQGQVIGVGLPDNPILPADVVVMEPRLNLTIAGPNGATGPPASAPPGPAAVRAVARLWPGLPAGNDWLRVSVPRPPRWSRRRGCRPLLAVWADPTAANLVQVWASCGAGLDPIADAQSALARHGTPAQVLWARHQPAVPPLPSNRPAGLHVLGDPVAAARSGVPWAGFSALAGTPIAGQVIAGDVAAAAIGRP